MQQQHRGENMTKITYAINVNHNEFSLLCQGHAGYADFGSDIVCAAISTLTQTLVMRLDDVTDTWSASVEPGQVWCYAKGYRAMESFETVLTGLKAVADMYPSYVWIEEGCTINREKPL